jgi:hypothetical protein
MPTHRNVPPIYRVDIFCRNDPAFLDWIETFPDGYVHNDNKVHRATCSDLKRLPHNAAEGNINPFTTMYPKTCSKNEAGLMKYTHTTRTCKKCNMLFVAIVANDLMGETPAV